MNDSDVGQTAEMHIKFYGVRGSISVSGDRYREFGGNTTCLQIMASETKRIGIIDAGTGIRVLGTDFLAMDTDQKEIFIAFTHFHWDHIQGFPFFMPAYNPEMKTNFLALGGERRISSLRDIFALQMKQTYFPVSMSEMGAHFEFLLMEDRSHTFIPPDKTPVKVTAVMHNHPGGAYSYRYERAGRSFVFSTDIEHGDVIDENIVALAQGADILIHDGQYSSDELPKKKGWGHSSYHQATEVAIRASVKQLVVTHHDPDHDDDYLRRAEKHCMDRFPDTVFAREGMVVST